MAGTDKCITIYMAHDPEKGKELDQIILTSEPKVSYAVLFMKKRDYCFTVTVHPNFFEWRGGGWRRVAVLVNFLYEALII